MATKRKYGFYPNNFDLDGFCNKYNLPANKVVSILDLFINKPQGQEDKRWITLHAALLRKRVGNIYKGILDALYDYEIIDINHRFEIGGHSKSYYLLDKYQYADNFNKYSVEKGALPEALERKNSEKAHLKYLDNLKLPKIKRNYELPDIIFNQRYRMLIHWFQDEKLTIDYEKAYRFIETTNYREIEPDKYLSYLVAVEMLRDKDYNLKSDVNGRFYSGITNLPKELRKFLLYDGEELAGVDVSNTQPLLLGELCNPVLLRSLKESNNIEVDDTLFDSFLSHLETNPEDLKAYRKLVQEGKLYESFIDISEGFDRPTVKENMVKIISDRGYNNTREKKKLREALKQKFPTIAMLLDVLKSVDHHYSSYTLMTMESRNFVQYFPDIFYIKVEHKNIPLFTIHDCFLTTKSNIAYLESELKTFFTNNLMINLPLSRE